MRPVMRLTPHDSANTTDANRCHPDQGCVAIALVRVSTPTDMLSLICLKIHPLLGAPGAFSAWWIVGKLGHSDSPRSDEGVSFAQCPRGDRHDDANTSNTRARER